MNLKTSVILICLILVSLCSSMVFAHGDVVTEEKHDGVNPIDHFKHGSIIPGIMFSVMWAGIFFGIIVLFLLVASRLVT
jgi:hypothetical protein